MAMFNEDFGNDDDDNLVLNVAFKIFKSYQDDGRVIMKGSVQ